MKFVTPKAWAAAEGGFSRASSATYVGADGLLHTAGPDELRIGYDPVTGLCTGAVIESGSANLLPNSQTMWSAWSAVNGSLANLGGVDPSGTYGVTMLTKAAAGNHYAHAAIALTPAPGSTWSFSIWLKNRSLQNDTVVLSVRDGGWANYGNATVAVSAAGWARYSVTVTIGAAPAAGLICIVDPSSDAGAAGESLLMWGAQLEAAGAASSYIPTGATSAVRAADQFTGTAPCLSYCSVPETDAPTWDAGATYATGARVVLATTHRVYESLIEGNYARAPTDVSAWVEVSPTNRWAALDASTGTVCTGADGAPLVLALRPGLVDALVLMDVDAAVAAVTVVDSVGNTLGSSATDMRQRDGGTTWYDWCYARRSRKRTLVITGLPRAADCTVIVVLDAPAAPAVGTLILGRSTELGDTNIGGQIGIVSYSKKTTSDWGVTTVVPRSFAKTMTVPVMLDNTELDAVAAALASVRDTPVAWLASDAYSSLAVYGWYRDFSIDIAYPTRSRCSLKIEGLT